MTDDRQTQNAASEGTSASPCSADDFRKIRHCIGLLNSMVRGRERHSATSARMTVDALEALARMEQPNAHPHGSTPARTVQGVVGASGLEGSCTASAK